LGKKIGSGEFGAVYEVTRKDCKGEWVAKITHVGDVESSAAGAKRAKLTKDRAGTSSTGGKELCARLLFWEYQMYQSYARNDPVFPRLPPRDSYGTASGWKYLVMERIPGVNLKQLVEARRRGSEKDDDEEEEEEDNNDVTAAAEYCKIGREILRGMRLIHDKGLLFRDVKPDNVIYDEASGRVSVFLCCPVERGKTNYRRVLQVALIDFGAAARFLTATGVQNMTPSAPAGTPIFMSIWTSESQPPSPRDDLDSLGYLMVYLLSAALDAPRPSVASKRGNGTSSSSSSFELPWSRLGSLPLVAEVRFARESIEMKSFG
jgi:serine/threonine protein kinase